jgi:predicted neuraminidase
MAASINLLFLSISALVALAAGQAKAKQPIITRELIMPGTPPMPYSHVCSIAEKADGNVVAVFQAGSGEGKQDCTIYTSTREKSSGTWSPVRMAVQQKQTCSMNPCLYENPSGELFLTFHSGGGSNGTCSTHHWRGFYTRSTDGGKTWAYPYTELPRGFLGCIKNQCVQLSNGEVLCPSSQEGVDLLFWEAHFETTNMNFTKFSRTKDISFLYSDVSKKVCQGIIQPTIFETSPGKVFALFRSGCDVLAQARSSDYGHTWPAVAESSVIPNPDAGMDGTVMRGAPDLGMLLIFNNSTQHRTPLSAAISLDEGHTWQHLFDLEGDPTGSFEYPTVVQSRFNPRIAHVCYTHTNSTSHRNIAFATIDWS